MRTRLFAVAMASVGLLFLSTVARSQAPEQIDFQGLLTDAVGAPTDAPVDLVFTLYDTSGASIWSETQSGVPVANGVFGVRLGTISSLDGVAFDHPLELGIKAGTDPETSPRTELTTAPYALSLRNLRVYPILGGNGPNLVGGHYWNSVASGKHGVTISGGGAGSTYLIDPTCDESPGAAPFSNFVGGDYGTVGGGKQNEACAIATIAGGNENSARGYGATIGGGASNVSSHSFATVSGGFLNEATESGAAVGGGQDNVASGAHSSIPGGTSNSAAGAKSVVGGGESNVASQPYATVSGGRENSATENYGSIGGGYQNTAEGSEYVTVSGGTLNTASGSAATIGGGYGNTTGDNYATVGGGFANSASALLATVGGGDQNVASGQQATVGGGNANIASGYIGVVGGGQQNRATAYVSTVPGGYQNEARGQFSLAAGYKARAIHDGSFVWNDWSVSSGSDSLVSTDDNQFIVRAAGGMGIGTNAPTNQLHVAESISGTAIAENHVALIDNTSMGPSADVLALRVARTDNPENTNAFITFIHGTNSGIGSISGNGAGGIAVNGTGADYAELLEHVDPIEVLTSGDVVGVFGGKITRDTEGADRIMAVSTAPMVVGNHVAPLEGRPKGYSAIAFIGQAPVNVRGSVDEGDFLVPSGRSDGTAVAVNPADVSVDQLGFVFATAWESRADAGVGKVNAAIGIDQAAASRRVIAAMHERMEQLEATQHAVLERLAEVERRMVP